MSEELVSAACGAPDGDSESRFVQLVVRGGSLGSSAMPRCSVAEPTPWLTEGTPEKIILDALQEIAFKDVDDPAEVAQHALHDAGFATLGMVYGGCFNLSWLRDGERVMSAGDGSGAAVVVAADGSERRYDIGDEVWS